MQIKGKYTTATVHTENIEDAAVQQIQEITDSPAFENQSVHYMPDVHIRHLFVEKLLMNLSKHISRLKKYVNSLNRLLKYYIYYQRVSILNQLNPNNCEK